MKMKLRPRKIEVSLSKSQQQPLEIVADGAMATGSLGQGKFIVLVILDTSERPDVEEFVRIHKYVQTGDVKVGWVGYPKGRNNLSLLIEAARPSEVTFFIRFDLTRHWALVDQIIRTRALYVQPGRQGDRLRATLQQPRILVEIGDLGFDRTWDGIAHDAVVRRLRSEGLSKADAKHAASELIQKLRHEFGDLRMPAD
jgi:hypothetical protein